MDPSRTASEAAHNIELALLRPAYAIHAVLLRLAVAALQCDPASIVEGPALGSQQAAFLDGKAAVSIRAANGPSGAQVEKHASDLRNALVLRAGQAVTA